MSCKVRECQDQGLHFFQLVQLFLVCRVTSQLPIS